MSVDHPLTSWKTETKKEEESCHNLHTFLGLHISSSCLLGDHSVLYRWNHSKKQRLEQPSTVISLLLNQFLMNADTSIWGDRTRRRVWHHQSWDWQEWETDPWSEWTTDWRLNTGWLSSLLIALSRAGSIRQKIPIHLKTLSTNVYVQFLLLKTSFRFSS